MLSRPMNNAADRSGFRPKALSNCMDIHIKSSLSSSQIRVDVITGMG